MISKGTVIPLILLLGAILLSAGPPQAFVLAQADPPPQARLPYDGLLDIPRLPVVEGADAPAATQAALAPEYAGWSRLVFQSARNRHDWEVYTAAGDGSGQVNLSNDAHSDIHPRLNRGATRVAFASDRDGNFEIYTMNTDGSGLARLTYDGANDVNPAWSPDGSRIAFQSYRDGGQADIYMMNADGSGLRRLTFHGDYDGEPAWSPDGSQIAFTRRSSDQYRIWAMNADGGNLRQLSNQPYSEYPAWSPDGMQIAYDADGDGDGWQELWLMDASGGNQRQVYDPGYQTDAWARSWSPDGRYIAFTRISFIQQGGNWYWTYAYLDAVNAQNLGDVRRLSDNGEDWYPDWQTTDIWPPSSNVLPLPAQSPAPFTVSWSGTDSGPSGIASYDIQVKDGPGGVWTDWLVAITSQSASYAGRGGHTYYFRARARDNGGNMEPWPADYDAQTTVEALPPISVVNPLPSYLGKGGLIRWHGIDPGGSGIRSYDVQYRDGANGAWTDWLTGVGMTFATFTGTIGHTYAFRVAATDNAGNVEAVHASAGDTSTVLATWAASGKVYTNRAQLAADATVTLEPTGEQAISLANGAYILYSLAAPQTIYNVTWAHACFGNLPAAHFYNIYDIRADAVLQPTDDVIQDGNFESGALAPGWQASGIQVPVLANNASHTGNARAQLGSLPASSYQAIATSSGSPRPIVRIDSLGFVHVLWEGAAGLSYVQRSPDGNWSSPHTLTGYTSTRDMAIDANRTVHVFWKDDVLYYAQRPAGGVWSAPEEVPSLASSVAEQFAVDQGGVVHLLLRSSSGGQWYLQRTASGAWLTPELMPYAGFMASYMMGVGSEGVVYACTSNLSGCRLRNTSGSWTMTPVDQAPPRSSVLSRPLVGPDGVVHLLLRDDNQLYYARRDTAGFWSVSPIAPLSYPTSVEYETIRLQGSSSLYVAWIARDNRDLYFSAKRGSATWTQPELIARGLARNESRNEFSISPFDLAGDAFGALHVVWRDSSERLYYTRQMPGDYGEFSFYVVGSGEGIMPRLVADDQRGIAHIIWDQAGLLYANSAAATTGDSRLAQTITIPADQAGSTLSFVYRLNDATAANRLAVQIVDGTSTTTLLSTGTDTSGWTHRWFNLASWAGKTVTLAFTLHQTAGEPATWADLDEVTVGSGVFADLYTSQAPQMIEPGEQITYTITYGNAGGVLAAGVRVSTTLPTGLTYISADPLPKTIAGQTLTWEADDQGPDARPVQITLRVQVAADVASRSILHGDLSITSDSCEVVRTNNTSTPAFFVSGSRCWLPLIRR